MKSIPLINETVSSRALILLYPGDTCLISDPVGTPNTVTHKYLILPYPSDTCLFQILWVPPTS